MRIRQVSIRNKNWQACLRSLWLTIQLAGPPAKLTEFNGHGRRTQKRNAGDQTLGEVRPRSHSCS